MMRRTAIALLLLATTAGPALAIAGDDPADGKRKVVSLVKPTYPQIARTMRISGVVKMEATVGTDGKPRLVDVKGGHPALVKAAVDAVTNWRWKTGPRETKEPIEMTFTPDSQ
jgi:TonB family protein